MTNIIKKLLKFFKSKLSSTGYFKFADEEFRKAMSSFVSGVTIVTTNEEGKLYGITINSFCSVSLNPPLVSFCLDKKSVKFPVFQRIKYFSVNILSKEQAHLSNLFSHHDDKNWEQTSYSLSKIYSSPLIEGALYHIECEKGEIYDGGDHIIILGRVVNLQAGAGVAPLIYYKSSYNNV